jgi:hypothetical protein
MSEQNKEQSQMEKVIQLAANDAERAARVVARSFYKILRKNGFSNEQIIAVANNMLECLIESLEGYKQKSGVKEK